MARYINIWKEKNIVISRAYDCDYGRWICEYEYMAAIEDNNGALVTVPLMDIGYTEESADKFLKSTEDVDTEILIRYDCALRDSKIKEGITEWICNECACSGITPLEAICSVVSLLTRYDMWKDEYAKYIDIEKIKEEYEG